MTRALERICRCTKAPRPRRSRREVWAAGDATLSVSDASTNATGRLVNGTFALSQPLQAGVGGTFASLEGSSAPVSLKTWNGPTSNETVNIGFKQSIGPNEALRTGAHSKTLTFTLSTTTP